jgi:Tfp pilus assembly PilM family ATPase
MYGAHPGDEPPAADPGQTFQFDPYAPPEGPSPSMPVAADDPQATTINQAIVPVLEEFIAEVRRSLDYFSSKGGPVQRVELCGGASKLHGLSYLLGTQLAVQCEEYDALHGINISSKRLEPQFVDEHRPDFAVAVGNGLHIFFD